LSQSMARKAGTHGKDRPSSRRLNGPSSSRAPPRAPRARTAQG
jgi:hypothetical protein